jgi:hypothetical protein
VKNTNEKRDFNRKELRQQLQELNKIEGLANQFQLHWFLLA